MIKKINQIKKFGIFKDFRWSHELDEFSRFNLLYGWNGCGKTTFSKLYNLVEYKDDTNLLKNLIGYEFSFELSDETLITQTNYQQNNLNLYVYNEVFKEKNIDWNNVVKSILLISDDVITEKTELDKKKLELGNEDKKTGILGDIKKHSDDKKQLEKDTSIFYSESAKKIKEEFKVIDTSDTNYFNYDKRKFVKFLENNKEKIKTKEGILNLAEISSLKESIKPNILAKVKLDINHIKFSWLKSIEEKVSSVLETSLIVNEVDRLKKYPEIGRWVDQGLLIHKNYKSTRCEFCNQELPSERLQELERHFSQAFKELKEKIHNALKWLPNQKVSERVFENEIEFYPEYQTKFKSQKNDIKDEIKLINSVFDQWITFLKTKESNPFEIVKLPDTIDAKVIETYNRLVIELKEIIKLHNNKTENFEEESKRLKSKLELHYSSIFFHEFDLNKILKTVEELEINLGKNEELKISLEKEIGILESKLSNEAFGAKEFNNKLHKFLGRDNIELKFDSNVQGYKIIRDSQEADNLSEGEKTAISFVYFITKLKENDNKIEDSIIVADDPISSFDSNNLFSAYSFLKNECEKAKQLFVITHNFSYFKLIRDWFNPSKPRTSVYLIEATNNDGKRTSSIKKASDSLVKYNSEYHFIFAKLYQYKDNVITNDEAYLVGNLLRKLLEAFLSFKYPIKRDNFKVLCDVSIEDEQLREKVYRFINKYSHNQTIEFFGLEDDTVLSESETIINDVFERIIKSIDSKHYEEMVKMVQNG